MALGLKGPVLSFRYDVGHLSQERLQEMLDAGDIRKIQTVRLTDPTDAEASPGRVTMIVNFDNSVNSLEVE